MTTLFVIIIFAVFIGIKIFLSNDISIEKAKEKLNKDACIIDVRSPGEFNSSHIEDSINIPFDETDKILNIIKNKDKPILLYCLSGARASIASSKIKSLGYIDVANMGSYGRAKKIVNA